MPTVFENIKGYRYFFTSLDRGEPPHIHVGSGERYAKFWLMPIELAKSRNIKSHELNEIHMTINDNSEEIIRRWHEHFGR
jgi:hypothetical protein